MRTIKTICGIGCYILALFPTYIALSVLSGFIGTEDRLSFYCLVSFFAVMAVSLVWAGSYFITRRDLPMSRNARSLVLLYVFCCIGILAAVPNCIKVRATNDGDSCVNNLRQIDGAISEWAVENKKTIGTPVAWGDIKPYIKLDSAGNIRGCPDGGTYKLGKVGDIPQVTCSLSTANPRHKLP